MTQQKAVWISLAPGLIASSVAAGLNAWFAPNFAFFALSQLIVIGVVALGRPRPGVVSGAAIAVAIYFSLFAVWAFTLDPPDAMVWIGYATVLPAAWVGILALCLGLRRRPGLRAATVVLLSTGAALMALFAGQLTICNTLMHCAL